MIYVLSCIGKVVEEVVAELLSDVAERRALLSDGQFGSRMTCSAIDAAAIKVDRAHAPWKEDNIMGVLLMDIKAAFLVLGTGLGNPPAVRVWTRKTGLFCSRPIQIPDLLSLAGANPDPYPSTRGFRRAWLDPSVPIPGSVFRVSHLSSHSHILLLIVKY